MSARNQADVAGNKALQEIEECTVLGSENRVEVQRLRNLTLSRALKWNKVKFKLKPICK